MWFRAVLLCLAGLWVGCDSVRGPHQAVVLPAVRGRVLDANTGEPVKAARVTRTAGESALPSASSPAHGAQRLQETPPARTARDGHFAMSAVRAGFLVFERTPPLLVSLRVEHGRYRTFTTNVDLLVVQPVQTPDGPVIDVGELAIQPRVKEETVSVER